jgi:hypothetical protein
MLGARVFQVQSGPHSCPFFEPKDTSRPRISFIQPRFTSSRRTKCSSLLISNRPSCKQVLLTLDPGRLRYAPREHKRTATLWVNRSGNYCMSVKLGITLGHQIPESQLDHLQIKNEFRFQFRRRHFSLSADMELLQMLSRLIRAVSANFGRSWQPEGCPR